MESLADKHYKAVNDMFYCKLKEINITAELYSWSDELKGELEVAASDDY